MGVTAGREGPSVTVVVPAFNEEEWIVESLTSILDQSRRPDEVIVVDDGSTDATADRVASFGARVRLVQQTNAGCPAAFNTGFREATGAYVALCPADDVWERQKLEWQCATLAAHPEVDILFGGAVAFGSQVTGVEPIGAQGVLDGSQLRRTLFTRNVIPDPSAVIRRDLHMRLGGYRPELSGGEDYEFWLRALREGACFYADERPMVRLRQHGANISAQAARVWAVRHQVHREYASDLGDPDFARTVLAYDLRRLARAELGLGRVTKARASYRSSFRERPSAAAAVGVGALALPGADRAVAALNRRRQGRRA